MIKLFALLSLIFGILFIAGQDSFKKLDAVLNKFVVRFMVGALLIVISGILFFMDYKLVR